MNYTTPFQINDEPRKWNQENGTKKMEAFGSRKPKGYWFHFLGSFCDLFL